VKNKKNSHARQEISNRKNGKSTRISLNWWILYVHYNLKFKAVGFSVPSYHGIGAVTYLVYHIFCTQTIFSRIKDDNFSDMFYNRHKYIKLLYPMM